MTLLLVLNFTKKTFPHLVLLSDIVFQSIQSHTWKRCIHWTCLWQDHSTADWKYMPF